MVPILQLPGPGCPLDCISRKNLSRYRQVIDEYRQLSMLLVQHSRANMDRNFALYNIMYVLILL
jgi:hypothetical protein